MSEIAAATTDRELIEAFVREKSERAFGCLVERHARWMFAAAFRQLRDRQLAEDATQAAFIILLQKAHAMPSNKKFSTWLFSVLQFTVKNLRRSRRRQRFHEIRAADRGLESGFEPAAAGREISDRLDSAVAALSSSDQATILLRFYQDLPFDRVGRSLGISEAAARKRTQRAINVLRRKLGVNVDATSIALGASWGMDHVPAALVHTITTGALAVRAGAAIPATISTATKGTAILMATTKVKIIAAIFIICFFAVPGTMVAIHYSPSLFSDSSGPEFAAAPQTPAPAISQSELRRDGEPWETENISSWMVGRLSPEVKILPTRFPATSKSLLVGYRPGSDRYVGINVSVANMLAVAYNWHQERILFLNGIPQDRYDFVTSIPKGGLDALQTELKSKLGLTAHTEVRTIDVLLLKVKTPNARGLKPPTNGDHFYFGTDVGDERIHWDDDTLSQIPQILEGYFKIPIIDETGLTQRFSIDLGWKELGDGDPNHDALKQVLLDQLGLELVPCRADVEMLVVEKAGVKAST